MKLARFVADDIKWFTVDKLKRRLCLVSISEAIMPFMVGGGDRRADRLCFLFLLSAVFLLSVGVAAIPEEQQKSVQEQPPQEVTALNSLLPIKHLIVVGRKLFLTPLFANASELASYANWGTHHIVFRV